MIDIDGNAECKLDDKLRLTLPSKMIKQLSKVEGTDQFIVKPAIDMPCIELYPKPNWDELKERLKTLDRFRPDVRLYLVHFFKGHQFISLDKANRLLLPQKLIQYAGIKKDVVLAPLMDVIQIWDQVIYNKHNEKLPDNFYDITNKALDNKNE
jgi:MraZ protein